MLPSHALTGAHLAHLCGVVALRAVGRAKPFVIKIKEDARATDQQLGFNSLSLAEWIDALLDIDRQEQL
jgi:hypothetical protein